jgi:cyclopropane-fatty-acyl-phospholipid synthase
MLWPAPTLQGQRKPGTRAVPTDAAARLAAAIFGGASRAFPVSLWDGTELPPARDAGVRGRVVLRHPRALRALLPPASERRLAEAVLDGDIELEGDVTGVLEAAAAWSGPALRLPLVSALLAALPARRALRGLRARLGGRRHSPERDRQAVRHHYDVSDDFYGLFLDRSLVYSCAFFASGTETLEEAQRAKLELVCRKLALRPGERLLDVGCGWGALLAHAAERFGVEAVGITLSENQLGAARRLAPSGPGSVSVLPADYRTLRPGAPFEKVASIGMMEHVGRERLDEYFQAIHRLLAPGGLFLNHAIASSAAPHGMLPWARRRRGDGFIHAYVFPDHDLVPIGEVISAAERAGFEVRDLESLREHYEVTLGHWLGRLEARFPDAEALAGARRARAWRLYLAGTRCAFRLGHISVFQLLLARRAPTGRVDGVPWSRATWYGEKGGGVESTPGSDEATVSRRPP